MNGNKSDTLMWVVIGLSVLILMAAIANKALVNKVADRVILKLQKEYSPSPYGPGIDPDKLDIERLRQTEVQPEDEEEQIIPSRKPKRRASREPWDDWDR